MLSQQSQPNLLPPSAPPLLPVAIQVYSLLMTLTSSLRVPLPLWPLFPAQIFSHLYKSQWLVFTLKILLPYIPPPLLEGSLVTFPCNADVLFDSLLDSNINFEDNVGDNHISTNARRRQHYRYSSSGSFLSCAQGAPLPPHPLLHLPSPPITPPTHPLFCLLPVDRARLRGAGGRLGDWILV